MKKGLISLKGALTALFVAAFFAVIGSSFGAIKAEAYCSIKRPDANGKFNVQYQGETINIFSNRLNKNVIRVKLDDTTDKALRDVKCTNGLKYRVTSKKVGSEGDSIDLYLSFYCKKNNTKVSKFSFVVDNQKYTVKFFSNKFDPIKTIKFGDQDLSLQTGKLGSVNYVTTLEKEKLSVVFNKGYELGGIQVGYYKNPTDTQLTWKGQYNNKKLKLSSVVHETETDDGSTESDGIATTVIRIWYRISGTKIDNQYVDYYLNRYVD
ncbi:MAG: hypothetical protein E7302_08295 [Butyrivibrio sp.]|nr:hypothetical protein [Butyrivibrio sp.]